MFKLDMTSAVAVLFVALIMINLFTAVLKLKLAKAMSTMVCSSININAQLQGRVVHGRLVQYLICTSV
jgi:hypothetical protein